MVGRQLARWHSHEDLVNFSPVCGRARGVFGLRLRWGILRARKRGDVNVFFTDSFDGDHAQVWVKVHEVKLDHGGTLETVFSDPNGLVIDLKSLRDANGERFAFIGKKSIPDGTYTKVHIIAAKDFTVVPTGSTTAVARQFDDSLDVAGGFSEIVLDLTARRLGHTDDDLVIDFDLANFTDLGSGKIRPALKEGDKTIVHEEARHEKIEFEGVVSALTGTSPANTFTIAFGEGRSVSVSTDANTNLFNSDGSVNPTLANGKRVHVEGTYSAATKTVAASAIRIHVDGDNTTVTAGALGHPHDADVSAGTFTVELKGVHGFVPMGTQLNVTTTSDTIYRAPSGLTITKAEFFAAMATAHFVALEGTYDSSSKVMTALRARIVEDTTDSREARIMGGGSHPDTATGTFQIDVIEIEGFTVRDAKATVYVNDDTVFVQHGQHLNKAEFFGLLPRRVRVRGVVANDRFTATQAEVLGD